MRKFAATATAAMLLGAAVPAHADVLSFSGSVTGLSTFVGVDATCAPLSFRSIIDPSSTVGTSSFGGFTYSTSTCLSAGGVSSFGSFLIDFGGDDFSGTFTGGATPTSTPGISDTSWLFTIAGGTGRFEGASGTFSGTGTTDARSRPSIVSINFLGDINAPAVPEPSTWGMMLLGFGGIGWALRRAPKRIRAIA
ncbi:PEPxxWA-CTERM sorting domain-containing protein [Sphingomonas rhizophila]|uniref:PEPxxWA-CTERM sorting domain-containing protein n=1 Tax=Sphingomonas rhizophila TaxID=2071607 RepID=UPI001FE863DC|nr:PEPxxWA-CTERM sorting domain-containing protein [Sphingomonas rhizophila]